MAQPLYLEGAFSRLAVSDGMGGTSYGEVATKIWLEKLKAADCEEEKGIEKAIEATVASLRGQDAGCATAGICVREEGALLFNVGDCRVYKKVGNFLERLSRDHSRVERLVEMGLIDEEEALTHPEKNILTSAITGRMPEELFLKPLRMKRGELYLLCSDGLWGEFGIEELEACFESERLEEVNARLFEALADKPQRDNVGYILCEV